MARGFLFVAQVRDNSTRGCPGVSDPPSTFVSSSGFPHESDEKGAPK